MKQKLLLASCLSGMLLLAACSNANSAQDQNAAPADSAANQSLSGNAGSNPGQGFRMNQQDLQKYVAEANAAADKTILTKDQFIAEMTALRDKQRAQFSVQGGQQFSRSGNPRFGSGGRMGQGAAGTGRMMQNRLAAATTFWKYTDPTGNEVLLALDESGQVLIKWPTAFGRGGRGMMSGSQYSGQ